ncbi:Crp/Fnr family transcriptional regulator [Desulforudis sp. 1088]|uniref:Crp/Fnr family transcriptional regulator n=3 Tax=Candidatus Desulforudis TaxID=471826 RepID=UPI003CE5AAE8
MIEQLKRISLFAALPPEALKSVASIVRERRYAKGRLIFVEGEPGDGVFLLQEGRIKLTRQTPDGREHILHYVNPGEVFAEIVLFDGGTYPATAEVVEDARVGVILNPDFDDLIVKHPELALAMLRIMSRRLRTAQEKVMSLALHDVTRRLVAAILTLAEDHGQPEGNGLRINFNITNQDLGNLIGASRESVNRTLGELRQAGAIEIDRQQIIVRDRKRLLSHL